MAKGDQREPGFAGETAGISPRASSASIDGELAYWMAVNSADRGDLPKDCDDQRNLVADARTVCCALAAEETRALMEDVASSCHLRVHELLLIAVAQVLGRWMGRGQVRIDVEGHGREPLFADIDLSRTAGWFTSVYPVVLAAGGKGSWSDVLASNKTRLREIPSGGIGYGLLRWLNEDSPAAARLAAAPQAEALFNYLGQFDSGGDPSAIFTLADANPGPLRSPRQRRLHCLEFLARIQNGCLRIELVYNSAAYRRSTIETLAGQLSAVLRELLGDCAVSDGGNCSPADFPLAGMDEAELSALSRLLDRTD